MSFVLSRLLRNNIDLKERFGSKLTIENFLIVASMESMGGDNSVLFSLCVPLCQLSYISWQLKYKVYTQIQFALDSVGQLLVSCVSRKEARRFKIVTWEIQTALKTTGGPWPRPSIIEWIHCRVVYKSCEPQPCNLCIYANKDRPVHKNDLP